MATIELRCERGAFWREASTLLVSDLHLGKAEAYRSLGVPLSEGVLAGLMEKDLARLAAAIRSTGAGRVMILGDLLHADAGITPAMTLRFQAWREMLEADRGAIEFYVVPGNHDRAIRRVEREWNLNLLEARHEEGSFVFTHEPCEVKGKYVWCGHVHPAVWVGGRSNGLKLACFHVGERCGVLPAFSGFTAGGGCRRTRGDRVFAIAETRVVEI